MTRYVVKRTFRDQEGMLNVGDIPEVERVSSWPLANVQGMLKLGILEKCEVVAEEATSKKGGRRDRAKVSR